MTSNNVTEIIATVAGGGSTYIQPGQSGPAKEARLNSVTDVAIDSAGNIYIADGLQGWGGQFVWKVDSSGIISIIAGNGQQGFSGDGGPATEASLGAPESLAVDNSGNLYIADLTNYRVRKVDTNGIITTIAGNGQPGFSGDGEVATEAMLYYPRGMAVDTEGNFYIAEAGRIRIVD